MKFEYVEYNRIASDEELLQDLRQVVNDYNLATLTIREYTVHGKFDPSTVSRRFGTWNSALKKAGISCAQQYWTEQDLFNNIERVWRKKGAQPSRRDMDNPSISSISSGAYLRKYGKWSDALKSFIDYINQDDEVLDDAAQTIGLQHKTSRDINLRLRFKILQRDHFKCCACGASPAKDPLVELHVDHIIPWSKGGETIIENLQTLCSKCNLGKSNSL